jgi:hypothetical protein
MRILDKVVGTPLPPLEFWFEISLTDGSIVWDVRSLHKAPASTFWESLKMVALEWNESRRKDRECMALTGQEYARRRVAGVLCRIS